MTTEPAEQAPAARASTEDWCERFPADGHSWTYTKHAGPEGIETRQCTLCGYVSVQPVAAERNALRTRIDGLVAELADLRANPRDEYHTMAELYAYRMLYHAHAARGWFAAGWPVVKSWRHHDGEECFGGGWFIVAADLPGVGQVSNHYRAEDWGLFTVPEVELAPEWDGHTPAVAADRLRAALGLTPDTGSSHGQ